MNMQNLIGRISDKILHSELRDPGISKDSDSNCASEISDLISLSIENDCPPAVISSEALDKPMLDIINRFKEEDYAFVEMIARANLTGDARERLADVAEHPESLSKGTLMLATVEGEYHRHGKDIVLSLSRGIGFNTIDLGMGIPVSEIFETVKEEKPDCLGISASTIATIPELKELVDNVREVHALENTKVLLGGYLSIDDTAGAIDADYRCSNLPQTIDLLLELAGSTN